MAVYGLDLYGLSRYGSAQESSLSVEPITATQIDYARVLVTWNPPRATGYTKIRLLRNSYGFSTTHEDGTIVLDADVATVGTVNNYDDSDVHSGRFYYYSVWLGTSHTTWNSALTYLRDDEVNQGGVVYRSLVDNNVNFSPSANPTQWSAVATVQDWRKGGDIGVLCPKNYAHTRSFIDLIPDVYKTDVNLLDEVERENTALDKFIRLFGFQFDILKSEYESYLHLNNPRKTKFTHLLLLGKQLGIEPEPALPAQYARLRVRYNAALGREKGTERGLENLVKALTGWEAEVSIGNNLMLNQDQANFINPQYPQWSPTINYPVNYRVIFNGNLFISTQNAAYGPLNAPNANATANTWWTPIRESVVSPDPQFNPATGGESTWEIFNTSSPDQKVSGAIIVGATSPTVAGNFTTNALFVRNNTGATIDLTARSIARNVGSTVIDKGSTTRYGIPLEHPRLWDKSVSFQAGDIVIYNRIKYIAKVDSTAKPPTGKRTANETWRYFDDFGYNSSFDEYIASAYSQAAIGTTAAITAVFMEFYDEYGRLMAVTPNNLSHGSIDTFDYPTPDGSFAATYPTAPYSLNTLVANPRADASPAVYSPNGYAFTLGLDADWRKINGVAYPSPASSNPIMVTTASPIDAATPVLLAVTFRSDLSGPRVNQGLVFRLSDASNYIRATRTGLSKVVAGAVTSLATWTKLLDHDRLVVELNGGNIKAYKYDNYSPTTGLARILLADVTDTFNSTANVIGLTVF